MLVSESCCKEPDHILLVCFVLNVQDQNFGQENWLEPELKGRKFHWESIKRSAESNVDYAGAVQEVSDGK